jgi:hypothetical protein
MLEPECSLARPSIFLDWASFSTHSAVRKPEEHKTAAEAAPANQAEENSIFKVHSITTILVFIHNETLPNRRLPEKTKTFWSALSFFFFHFFSPYSERTFKYEILGGCQRSRGLERQLRGV